MEIKNKCFYLSGINGIGMSAIAQILKELGAQVKGSDISHKPITDLLEKKGIKVNLEQVKENITDDIDYFVYSTAISKRNSEYVEAMIKNKPLIKRGEMLSHIFNTFENSIAIAGTHGKTTTSSMMAVVLKNRNPYFAIGGIVPEYGNNMQLGSSDFFIAEADESDNSFLYLHPSYSVITNIELDHLEHHHSFENILKSFNEFIDNTKKEAILCYDCNNIRQYIDLENEKISLYSIADNLSEDDKSKLVIYAEKIEMDNEISKYTVVYDNKKYDFELQIPGKHNISNTLPIIYLALKNGVEYEEIKEFLYHFKGANRRFQILYDKEFKIIDDYGHHPTEILATINAARERYYDKEIILIFEPHRYTRTHFFKTEFINVLRKADKVYLLPIYSANEKNEYNISSDMICEEINNYNNICELSEYNNILEKLHLDKNKENKIYIFMGAGTITKLAHSFAEMEK